MKTGLKSILFGCHQFIYHPTCVLLAWIELYGIPNYKELICIFIHDLGYYRCQNMDDSLGQLHPEFAGNLAFKLFKNEYYRNLCLGHSRHYAKKKNISISKLYRADKLSMKYDHPFLYLIRTYFSGELKEFMYSDNSAGKNIKNKYEWCKNARKNGIQLSKNPNSIAYQKEY
jgi:hypothetical protein